jgi:hypothetical protein
MKATIDGSLNPIPNCYIEIPTKSGTYTITMNNLPDVSDTKSAIYNNEGIIGRSFPIYTYSHSGDRQINMQIHFFAVERSDVDKNIQDLRAIQSAVYPREGLGKTPYRPPAICKMKCGNLLAGNPLQDKSPEDLCVILQSYSVKFPTEVAFDSETITPYRFDVETSWLTAYSAEQLPFANRIYETGR